MEEKVNETLSCVSFIQKKGKDTLPGEIMASLAKLFDILVTFIDIRSDYEFRLLPHSARLRYLEVSLLQSNISVLIDHYKFLEER